MAKKDKPTPINREKFLNNLHDSYQLPEQSLQPYDNDNPEAKYTKPGQPEFLRGNEISMKGDTTPNIKVSLEDHDETILYYLKNNINPTVEINGNKREVPVIYGSPERWKSIQKDGFYRDKNGKIQTPLIVLKRESFEKNRNIGNKLDGNKVNNVQYFKQGYSKRNSYDNFSVLQNQIPSIEYKVGIIPDYITITYKLIIFTDYVEHMNQLVEAIEFASDSYWGDKERFMFRAAITSFPTATTVENGNDRASRSELTLTVNGYIIPDTINANNAAPSPKSFNVTKLLFKEFFEEPKSLQRNVPVGNKRINIYNPQSPQNQTTNYYGNFSGSFIGDGSGLINLPIANIDTGSLVTTSSFDNFTSSYYEDSSSFDNRISNINFDTSSLLTSSSFNNFTSSYNTGSFTGSFIGDGSQLTGIVSSKWTSSLGDISRDSNVSITGSLTTQTITAGNGGGFSTDIDGNTIINTSGNSLSVNSGQSTALTVAGGNNSNNIATFKSISTDNILAYISTNGSIFTSGSIIAEQGITGSLFGTASWANDANNAYYSLVSTSSSQALTASFSPNYLPIIQNTFNTPTMSFSIDGIYGTDPLPISSSITSSLDAAIFGVANLVIYSGSVNPIPTGSIYYRLSGSPSFVAGTNYIFFTYISNTNILYSINQAT